LLFVFLEGVQLALFAIVVRTHVPPAGVAFMVVLLVGLAYGSGLAWGLLLFVNAITLLGAASIAFSSGSGATMWGNVAVLLLTSLALVATLLSSAMRRHIGRHPHRSASSSA
jgi:hypothetical protein